MEILSASATKKQVELQLNGKSCIMNGIRRCLYEIIYNLCDNAIRYNKEGGKVTIDLEQKNNNTILSVADTGSCLSFKKDLTTNRTFFKTFL